MREEARRVMRDVASRHDEYLATQGPHGNV